VAGDENCDGLPRGELELGLQIDARVQVSCSVTPDGGLLIAGSAYSISDLDGSPPPELPFLDGTAFVAKFDAAGGFLWHYAFSDPTRNELTSEIPIVLVPDDQGGAVVFLVPRQGASVVGDLVLQGDGIQIVNLSPTGEATLVGYVPVASGTNPVSLCRPRRRSLVDHEASVPLACSVVLLGRAHRAVHRSRTALVEIRATSRAPSRNVRR
jgi:hypothetical protein